MRSNRLLLLTLLLLVLLPVSASQKKFFNLTASEIKVDSLLPRFVYSVPLSENYSDSIYSVTITYPEFVDMTPDDIKDYNHVSGAALPSLPIVNTQYAIDRKKGSLVISFCPLVFRDNKYRALVSFMLTIDAKSVKRSVRKAAFKAASSNRYASHSVLATGKWAKIRVSNDGVYQLTDALIRKAGFTDLSKVKVYGYGGHMQNETLTVSDLTSTDDLSEVPQYVSGGKHLFYGKGPVSWSSKTATVRTRNPYSDYGYYFITQGDDEPVTVDSTSFVDDFYPSTSDYHSIYEVDGYSWYHGGRNLFDSESISLGSSKKLIIKNPSTSTSGKITVRASAGVASSYQVSVNGVTKGTSSISIGSYDKGNMSSGSYTISDLGSSDTVEVTPVSGGPIRLDFVAITRNEPTSAPNLSKVSTTPEYVYNITNQDLHADSAKDMVIIIPTSQKLLAQAQRLATFHEEHDSLRVRIVPADELYNEFSSGTPDANAYRRYLKMLYDKAESSADQPKYLLLFGDGVWDNRMLTSDCETLSSDDYLLCYESENSFNEVNCYVDDSWYGLLDDGEGGSPVSEQIDVAVGRFPVSSVTEAKAMVDKTISYAKRENIGDWNNTLVFMGDDGNSDLHMHDEDSVATIISGLYPGYVAKRVMWDAYTRVVSSTGATYPEVSNIIKQYQKNGALIMDYAGHGSSNQLSHEAVLKITDFESFTNTNLPLWITASCDVMPFDDSNSTIGEAAVVNPYGGAVAFYGTTRTVYAYLNIKINLAFLRRVLSKDDNGVPLTIGEAHRLAQNDLIRGTNGDYDLTTNKLQYTLLGDPAIALTLPTMQAVVDSINGVSLASGDSTKLSAGSIATIKGHVVNGSDFKGIVSATVRDTKELVTCKANNVLEADPDNPFTYYDRLKVLFNGSDSIRNGEFSLSFAVPKDINYENGSGEINIFAYTDDKLKSANGYTEQFLVGGSSVTNTDSVGPSIYCYLNSSSFVNGGDVNTTPFFVADIADKDGINASGSGIGHDLELIIDGDMTKTYQLNDNFSFDFGSYIKGSTWYSIPELTTGSHKLLFRAWDILNNSSSTELSFNVVSGLQPKLFDVSVSDNPAQTSTTFIISHDRIGSSMDVKLEVFDISGRILWEQDETCTSESSTYTTTWDLTLASGAHLNTGVYLYRASISSDGSSQSTKAKKLIVLGNN